MAPPFSVIFSFPEPDILVSRVWVLLLLATATKCGTPLLLRYSQVMNTKQQKLLRVHITEHATVTVTPSSIVKLRPLGLRAGADCTNPPFFRMSSHFFYLLCFLLVCGNKNIIALTFSLSMFLLIPQ